jgi:hypothetical protein
VFAHVASRSEQDPIRSTPRQPGTAARHGRRRRGWTAWPWAATAGLLIGNLFLHKPISDLCDALFARIGRGPYERWTLLGIAALSLAGALFLIRRGALALRQGRVLVCFAALAGCTLAAQRWLLVSNVELIHFPQFALLAGERCQTCQRQGHLRSRGGASRPLLLLAVDKRFAGAVFKVVGIRYVALTSTEPL